MKVLLWPHPSLKAVCSPVDPADPDFLGQLEDMKRLMVEEEGLGLAANQVGIHKRMLVARGDDGQLLAFVNPVVFYLGNWRDMGEGCLSLPGIFVQLPRCTEIQVEHADPQTGKTLVTTCQGRLAQVLQHEVDHLNGKVMVDRLPPGRRDQLRAYVRATRISGR